MLAELVSSTLILIAIIDPFVSLSALLTIHKEKDLNIPRTVTTAVGIAGALMLLFILLGNSLLGFFQVSLEAFKIGGGLIILLLGIKTVLGFQLGSPESKSEIAVVIGTPLITGPGVATTLILLRNEHGVGISLLTAGLCLAFTWLFLVIGDKLHKFAGERMMLVFSRVIGLFLTAYAMQLMLEGIKSFF